jgi:hypothetical protein
VSGDEGITHNSTAFKAAFVKGYGAPREPPVVGESDEA